MTSKQELKRTAKVHGVHPEESNAHEKRTVSFIWPFTRPGDVGLFDQQLELQKLTIHARHALQDERLKEVQSKTDKVKREAAKLSRTPTGKSILAAQSFLRENRHRLSPELIEAKCVEIEQLGISTEYAIQYLELLRQGDDIGRQYRIKTNANAALVTVCELGDAAREKKDPDAAKALFELMQWATLQFQLIARLEPDLFKPFARDATCIPVLASRGNRWLETARKIVKTLELGENTSEGSFKETAHSAAEAWPARAWAKEAVEAIMATRNLLQSMPQVTILLRTGLPAIEITVAETPDWAHEAHDLPEFTQKTAKQWTTIVRKMIRQQCPDFHSSRHWDRYAKRFEHMTTAEKQARILDLICSAVETIGATPSNPISTTTKLS